jgi:hypothetical protein
MKSILLLLPALVFSFTVAAQRTIKMRGMWDRPQVHASFEGHIISFRIEDINKALSMMYDMGHTKYGTHCSLDTAGDYYVEIYRNFDMEYKSPLQPILQRGVGAYLISAGRAYIQNTRNKKIPEVRLDIQPMIQETEDVFMRFYDPVTKKMVFAGSMKADMYNKDLGLD